MLEGKRVAVVVPAYDEESLVVETLRGIPDLVDRVYVVDDASRDATARQARDAGDDRVEVLGHERNLGVGAAIVTGYRKALEEEVDVTCVMAADNQMDPAELTGLVEPVARGEVEYAKANRFATGEAWTVIPRTRFLGNAALSLLTKIRLHSVVPRISWLLFTAFWWRLGHKYVIRDFHPLVFFYVFGLLMFGVGLVLGVLEVLLRILGNQITPATIVLVAVLLIAGLQLTLFAMWFDMEANKDLR